VGPERQRRPWPCAQRTARSKSKGQKANKIGPEPSIIDGQITDRNENVQLPAQDFGVANVATLLAPGPGRVSNSRRARPPYWSQPPCLALAITESAAVEQGADSVVGEVAESEGVAAQCF
jgi:hypothetical protein